jgi:hypothetical protein
MEFSFTQFAGAGQLIAAWATNIARYSWLNKANREKSPIHHRLSVDAKQLVRIVNTESFYDP